MQYTRDEAFEELVTVHGYSEDSAPHILDSVQEGQNRFIRGYIMLRYDAPSQLFIFD